MLQDGVGSGRGVDNASAVLWSGSYDLRHGLRRDRDEPDELRTHRRAWPM
ncbi:MAG: hypothetical protein U0670_02535 [Anaerolineae bacterium]